jgi:hypothetical protein
VDLANDHVALAMAGDEGDEVELLGPEAPRERPDQTLPGHAPALSTFGRCTYEEWEDGLTHEVYSLKDLDAVARAESVARLRAERSSSATRLVLLARALKTSSLDAEAASVRAELEQRFPGDPYVRLLLAEQAADRSDWGGAIDVLEPMPADGLQEQAHAHRHHQLGLALYRQGRLGAAAAELERGAAVGDDPCSLAGWGEWVDRLARRGGGPLAPTDSPLLRLQDSVIEADVLLAAKEGAKAQALLDTPACWSVLEVQTLARLAHALLLQDVHAGEQVFRKRLILSLYADWRDTSRRARLLELRVLAWSAELQVFGSTLERGKTKLMHGKNLVIALLSAVVAGAGLLYWFLWTPDPGSGSEVPGAAKLAADPRPITKPVRDRAIRDDLRKRILERWASDENPVVAAAAKQDSFSLDSTLYESLVTRPQGDLHHCSKIIDRGYLDGIARTEILPVARRCHQAFPVGKDAGDRTGMFLTIVADENHGGIVEKVEVEENPRMAMCIREAVFALAFPPPAQGAAVVTLSYPLAEAPW